VIKKTLNPGNDQKSKCPKGKRREEIIEQKLPRADEVSTPSPLG
jgi:hypothetical protein